MKEEKTKTALITGGSSGIGKAIAKKLAQEKIQVAITDIQNPEWELKNVQFKKCDVTKGKEVDELYDWFLAKHGVPDILVLNAGQGIKEKLAEGDPEKWQHIINTNLMGPLRCIRAFMPEMLKRKSLPDRQAGGNVIFISSVSANNPHEYGGIYSATKTALEIVAETLRLETLPHIQVTVICPGIVDTGFFKNEISGNSNIEKMKMGAISPEEIAEDVWYILNKKKGTSINKIVTRPVKQGF